MRVSALFIALFLAAMIGRANAQGGVEYLNLPLHAFGIEDSQLDLYIEDEILVPSLVSRQLADIDMTPILPYGGSSQANKIAELLRTKPELSLGHAMPYFYIAINHAFSRIFRNVLLVPRPIEESFGLEVDSNGEHLKNLRDLIPVREVKGRRLRVEIYFGRDTFDAAAAEIRLHSARAFWDPGASRIALFVDRSVFHWLPYKAAWGEQSTEQTAIHIRDYVIRKILKVAGHEIFHFVQHAIGAPVYNSPFLAEATAVFVHENLASREDMFQLGEAQTKRGLPRLPPRDSLCWSLIPESPPFESDVMYSLYLADQVPADRAFDLERALMAEDGEFYQMSDSDLRAAYSRGIAFIQFASQLPRPDFLNRFGELTQNSDSDKRRAAVAGINEHFMVWWMEFRAKWWANPESRKIFATVSEAVSACLGAGHRPAAFAGARWMAALRPDSPTPLVFEGDVFWRVEIPFFALDLYAQALKRAEKHGFGDEPAMRIASRLGDAYEALGDLASAMSSFRRFQGPPPRGGDPGLLLIDLRSKLKLAFYDRLLQVNGQQNSDVLLYLNSYVEILQLEGCPDESERERIDRLRGLAEQEQWLDFESRLIEHYELLREKIVAYDAGSNFRALLGDRRSSCS